MSHSFQRAGQLGLLARDLASIRCRTDGPKRDEIVRRTVDRLGLMHGLPQKIGQLLAFSELKDGDPAFACLTESEVTLCADETFAEIEAQLGRTLNDVFAWMDRKGISASIGQVHRATLHDGREVAVKIQHRDIAAHVDWDLRALGWLSAPVGDLRKDFDLAAYRREIGMMLRAELDYTAEAGHLRQFGQWARRCPDWCLPQLIEELSGPAILTSTWVAGDRLSEACRWSAGERGELATLVLRFFLHGTFQWHCLHADPHPGNYRFIRRDGRVRLGILDFGCVKHLGSRFVAGLRELIADGQSGRWTEATVWSRFLQLGFDSTRLKPVGSSLFEVARVLVEPFVSTKSVEIKDWNPGSRIAAILGPHRMAFRLAGPPDMIFFLRAFQGVLHHLKALDAPVSWRDEFLAATDAEPVSNSAATPSAPSNPPGHPCEGPSQSLSRSMKSNALHIQVTESSQTKVALTFDAGATDYLADLVPGELRERLQQRRINLKTIADDARQRDYAPGDLFTLVDGNRTVRVWLA
jgi:hypothetical protein